MVKEALELVKSFISATIDIQSDLPDNLVNIMGDATQIRQIIMNLCGNAADAMQEKGGVLSIRLFPLELDHCNREQFPHLVPGPYVQLVVRDTGHGMDQQTQEKIFDPYFTTKAINKGTGLGLSIVHSIMQEYSGAITVESSPGQGACFTLVFPGIPLSDIGKTIDPGEDNRG